MSNFALSSHAARISRLWINRLLPFFILAVLAILPTLLYPVFVMKVLCFGLLAASFNFLFGYVGLLSFGHAAFFGAAAYVTGYATRDLGLTPELGVLLGGLASGLLGALFGSLAIRRSGFYLAMITLALAQLVYFVCIQSRITGGEDGMQGIPRGWLFGLIDLSRPIAAYYFTATITVLAVLLLWRVVNSPFGNILIGIRENEPRMISLGYRVQRYKLAAFAISGGVAGLGGATKAIVFQFATTSDVHWHMSGEVILMTLLGGLGTAAGPFIGATIVVALETYLSNVNVPVPVVVGAVFVVCVTVFRRGVVGEIQARFWRKK